jgi:hypothetical protein
LKVNPGQNVFKNFCERKGLNRRTEIWERKIDDELKLKENELKEILDRKKLARSKKTKLELTKECKEKLFVMVENWKETPSMEEERTFKKLKEIAMKERIVEILGQKRNPDNRQEGEKNSEDLPKKMTPEDSRERQPLNKADPGIFTQEEKSVSEVGPSLRRKVLKTTPASAPGLRKQEDTRKTASTTPRKTTWKKMTRRGHGGNSPVAKTFVRNLDLKQNLSVKRLADRIETSQQINLISAKVCGQQPKDTFTKPHLVYSSSGVQIPSNPQCTGPTNQWEESSGTRLRSRRPSGQLDQRNEQNHEQKLQIGEKRKDLTRPASTQ